ncbi:MAG: MMPL family transporter [Lentisphaerae bacterium]|nr:MMPL family transporter [Lentisphaerota bacterium]
MINNDAEADLIVPKESDEAGFARWKTWLPEIGLRFPVLTILVTLVITVLFAMQFPKVTFDNDPENMLSKQEPIRVFNDQIKAKYALYDFVIVGVVNDADPNGIFNVTTLNRLDQLTHELLSLKRGEDGLPRVTRKGDDGTYREETLDLRPAGRRDRILATVFNQNSNDLFIENEDGSYSSAIINHELIAPSLVDNIKQAELGSLKMEYLMENPPETEEDALVIRNDAMSNPLYSGTLVAEDEQAICIYIPIITKNYSYNVSQLVEALTADWDGDDLVMITGQPVAQDTFGVQMLTQMAVSAPLAGLVIFLLLLYFFKRLQLIIAPMLVALISVITTMGLLIGLGYDVHIMSSMIAIFLIPISVSDSVHILSQFYDYYPQFKDKAKTIRHVMSYLFMPMLYTSLTTLVGFASLATTPIPPVKVFGLHVAFGVAVAWLLTMVLVPAYIMLAVSNKSLKQAEQRPLVEDDTSNADFMTRFLERIGFLAARRPRTSVFVITVLIAIAIAGIMRIRVNDNPIKWFTRSHPIRVADDELNRHFGGTYTAYLSFSAVDADAADCMTKGAIMKKAAEERFAAKFPAETKRFMSAIDGLLPLYRNVFTADANRCFVDLVREAERIDDDTGAAWNTLADTINYLDSEGLTKEVLLKALSEETEIDNSIRALFEDQFAAVSDEMDGADLQDAALDICDEFTDLSFRDFVFEQQAELEAPLFKRPEMLRYLQDLQEHIIKSEVVGKTSSAVDALIKGAYELAYVEAPSDATEEERIEMEKINEANKAVPSTAAAVGQVFTQLEGMKRRDYLFHMVTRNYQEANLWVQLKSGDNIDMETVVEDVHEYIENNPPPVALDVGWSGMTYINVVWQDKMVTGMFGSLASSFLIVFIMMVALYRSVLFGLLSMIPLSVTILVSYGMIGWLGKDYDMPIAVLSALTLGMSVDFAVHFLQRARDEVALRGSWLKALPIMFRVPAVAISRNAITIALGFMPLLAAPLLPYKTVGSFLAAIMVLSWIATLLILPALLSLFERRAFPNTAKK